MRPGAPVDGAAYLVRFDDVSPTMNRAVWDVLEDALTSLDIRPIVGVIPDNRDEGLVFDPPDPRFWERVRGWQRRGWSIALHGYEHRYVTDDRGLYGWNARSEFAGLPLDEQRRKLRAAVAILEREGIRADAWMAPNHSFDRATLQALRELGITTVTDGLGLYPHRDDDGVLWLPVQLRRLLPRRAGVWTVCLHHNWWDEQETASFVAELHDYAGRITNLSEVAAVYANRRRTWQDAAFAAQRRARKKLATAAGRARS